MVVTTQRSSVSRLGSGRTRSLPVIPRRHRPCHTYPRPNVSRKLDAEHTRAPHPRPCPTSPTRWAKLGRRDCKVERGPTGQELRLHLTPGRSHELADQGFKLLHVGDRLGPLRKARTTVEPEPERLARLGVLAPLRWRTRSGTDACPDDLEVWVLVFAVAAEDLVIVRQARRRGPSGTVRLRSGHRPVPRGRQGGRAANAR
jgi:hypothetical protein